MRYVRIAMGMFRCNDSGAGGKKGIQVSIEFLIF
jgi:hypothetical protein